MLNIVDRWSSVSRARARMRKENNRKDSPGKHTGGERRWAPPTAF